MADIRDLFPGKQPQISQGQNNKINIDVNSLDDMPCIKCGEKEFINITRIKKLTRTVSPTGQEGNVNINMLKCHNCGWLFNPKEWQDDYDAKTKTVSTNEKVEIIQLKKEDKEIITDNRILCRKCGAFYEKDTEHKCKK